MLCFRWVEEDEKIASDLAELTGFTEASIKKDVKTIQLMKKNNDDKLSHFSYYDVLVRNRAISTAIAKRPTLKLRLLDQIKNEAFPAQKLRDQLPTVLKKPKTLRKYEDGDITLEDAFDRAKISGTEQRLKKVLDELDHIEKSDIDRLEYNQLKAAQQVARKIRQGLKRVSDMINAALGGAEAL